MEIEGTVGVLSTYENCIFPEGSEVVSAVYDVSASQPFPVSIAVELKHCVYLTEEREALQMSFVLADTRAGPPYKFSELEDENFTFNLGSCYGRIELNHFSRIAITIKWLLGFKVSLYAGVFYLPENEAVFAVAKDLSPHIHVSLYTYMHIPSLLY